MLKKNKKNALLLEIIISRSILSIYCSENNGLRSLKHIYYCNDDGILKNKYKYKSVVCFIIHIIVI